MISILYDVNRYRKFLAERVNDGNTVIELGPHLGESTRLYVEKTELTVAVDKSSQTEKAFEKILPRFKNLRLVKGDVREFGTIQKAMDLTQRCDVLAVDMGGGRFSDTVFKVWATWAGIFRPKHSVLRNRGLAEFIQRAEIHDESVMRKFPDDGWLAEWGRATPHTLKKQLKEFEFWVDL